MSEHFDWVEGKEITPFSKKGGVPITGPRIDLASGKDYTMVSMKKESYDKLTREIERLRKVGDKLALEVRNYFDTPPDSFELQQALSEWEKGKPA